MPRSGFVQPIAVSNVAIAPSLMLHVLRKMNKLLIILSLVGLNYTLLAQTSTPVTFSSADGLYHMTATKSWEKRPAKLPIIIEIEKQGVLHVSVVKLPLEPLRDLTPEEILVEIFESMKKNMRLRLIQPIKSSNKNGIESSVVMFDTLSTANEKPLVTRYVLFIIKNEYDVLQTMVGSEGKENIPEGLIEALSVANSLNFNRN